MMMGIRYVCVHSFIVYNYTLVCMCMCKYYVVMFIGASVSEPHTSAFNVHLCQFGHGGHSHGLW